MFDPGMLLPVSALSLFEFSSSESDSEPEILDMSPVRKTGTKEAVIHSLLSLLKVLLTCEDEFSHQLQFSSQTPPL